MAAQQPSPKLPGSDNHQNDWKQIFYETQAMGEEFPKPEREERSGKQQGGQKQKQGQLARKQRVEDSNWARIEKWAKWIGVGSAAVVLLLGLGLGVDWNFVVTKLGVAGTWVASLIW